LAGGVSAGIEPIPANVWTDQSAKGTFIRKNPVLEKALEELGQNSKRVWDKILADGGSIQDLKFLDDWCFVRGKLTKVKDVPEFESAVPFKDPVNPFKDATEPVKVKEPEI
jgi:ribonucleotide reductase alpha subunit